jgi:hypothetical protein
MPKYPNLFKYGEKSYRILSVIKITENEKKIKFFGLFSCFTPAWRNMMRQELHGCSVLNVNYHKLTLYITTHYFYSDLAVFPIPLSIIF